MEREDGAEPRDFTPDFFPKLRRATAAAALVLLICAAASLAALFGSSSFGWIPTSTPPRTSFGQLSQMDLTLTPSIVPRMAANFSARWNISLLACGTQMFFSLAVAITECILITLMCFDHYVAICSPLRYPVIISPRACLQMAVMSWAGGALMSLGHTAFTLHLQICSPREIPTSSVKSWLSLGSSVRTSQPTRRRR